MQYQVFKEKLKDFSVFSLSDIRKIEPSFHRRRLNEWQEKGYIKKLRRGYYIFADVIENEEMLFLIANHLYTPSYISFESALSYYGLIPEGVYSITSASGRKTARFSTPIAEFAYRKIKQGLLFGYRLQKLGNQSYKVAEIEKVVLDYLYVNPHIAEEADFHEWRFNSAEFLAKADLSKLFEYAEEFQSKILLSRLKKLLALIQRKEV
jgi:predicted transcriptional regulator of viral defense system